MSTKDRGDGCATGPERDSSDPNTFTSNSLATTLFGKTRRQILSVLYARPDERYYLRQLTSAAGVAVGAAQRELALLTGAGIIRRDVEGRQVYFRANTGCPVFGELLAILRKTGAADRAPSSGTSSQAGPSAVVHSAPATRPRPWRPSPPPNPAFVWMTRR